MPSTRCDLLGRLRNSAVRVDTAIAELYRLKNDLQSNVQEQLSIASETRKEINGPPTVQLLERLWAAQWCAVKTCQKLSCRASYLAMEPSAVARESYAAVTLINQKLTQQYKQKIRRASNLKDREIAKQNLAICESIERRSGEAVKHIRKVNAQLNEIDEDIRATEERLLSRWRELV